MTGRTVNEEDLVLAGAGGLPLAATSFGERGHPGVVLLHGFGQSRGAWRTTARTLAAKGWHVLTLDLRGHGDSAWADDYRFADFERDVRLVAGQFGSRPAVVGASMGGILTLVTHDEHQIASAVGLVDVVPKFDLDSGLRVQAFMARHQDGFRDLDEATASVAAYLPHRSDRGGEGLLRNLRQDADGRLRWKWDPRFADGIAWLADGPDDDIAAVADAMSERMTAAAARLDVPTLLVRGQLSTFVPSQAADDFARLVPQAEVVVIDRAGHMVAGDQNDAFGVAVVDFLARHHPPATD